MFSTAITIISRDRTVSLIVLAILAFIVGTFYFFYYLATAVFAWYHTILGILALVAISSVWKKHLSPASRKTANSDEKMKGVEGHYVAFLEKEVGMLELWTPTIYSIFESTNDSADRKTTLDWIRRRVKVITEKNPFLLGRLRTDPATSLPAIWIPNQEKSKDFVGRTFEKFLTEVTVDDDVEGFKKKNLNYERSLVCCGRILLDEPDQLIAKITVIKSSKSNKFAIMFSMCHLVADGHSGSQIYAFLDPKKYPKDEDVFPLIIERDRRYDLKTHHLQHEGQQHLKKFGFFLKEFIFDITGRVLPSFLAQYCEGEKFRAKCSHRWFKLRKDWIEQEKKKYQLLADTAAKEYHENHKKKPDASTELSPSNKSDKQRKQEEEEEQQFVDLKMSTFVIVAKYMYEKFFAHRNCAMFGCVFEFRSRFYTPSPCDVGAPKPVDEKCVGNYMELLLFTREEAADPLKIRRLVNSKGRSSEIDTAAYDAKDLIPEGGGKYSHTIPIISSWTTYYIPPSFPGFKATLNVPLINTFDTVAALLEPMATVFVCNGDGDLGILNTCDSHPSNDKEAPLDGELIF